MASPKWSKCQKLLKSSHFHIKPLLGFALAKWQPQAKQVNGAGWRLIAHAAGAGGQFLTPEAFAAFHERIESSCPTGVVLQGWVERKGTNFGFIPTWKRRAACLLK